MKSDRALFGIMEARRKSGGELVFSLVLRRSDGLAFRRDPVVLVQRIDPD